MKFKKSAVCIFLCLTMLLFPLAGCAKNDGNDTKSSDDASTESANTTEAGNSGEDSGKKGFSVATVTENVPQSNFQGKTFTMLIDDPDEQVWTYTNMIVEESSADTIDDAYYRRNRAVEERLGITLKQVITPLSSAQKKFKTSAQSGDNAFDCAFLRYNDASKLATENFCVELSEMEYMDLSKPWWDKNSLRDLSIANKNFLVASDITIADNDNTWLIYFDKLMVENYGLDLPYNLVAEKKWTFDKMLEMMKVVEKDVDSNGKMDKNDQFGMLTHGENYAAMWISANTTIISKDENDIPYLSIDNEKFITVWTKIVDIMNDMSCKANDIEFISLGLANGQTLFGTEILKFVRNYRENEREFGIIPVPLFTEDQPDYHTYVAVSAPMLIVPTSNKNLTDTSIILEVLAAEGNRIIMPAYYEVAIKSKFTRDVESVDMLDIAFATRKYDLGVVYNWGALKDELTNNYGPKKNINISGLIEKRIGKFDSEMAKTLENFDK